MHSNLKIESTNYSFSLYGTGIEVTQLENYDEAFDRLNCLSRISNIEYGGHFGDYVFFTAEKDKDRDFFIHLLLKIIKEIKSEVSTWKYHSKDIITKMTTKLVL